VQNGNGGPPSRTTRILRATNIGTVSTVPTGNIGGMGEGDEGPQQTTTTVGGPIIGVNVAAASPNTK
jgi:hypothetical protein